MRHAVRLLLGFAAIMAPASVMAQTVTPASAAASAAQAAPAPSQVRSWLTLTEQQSKFGTYTGGANEPRFAGGKGDARPDGTARKAGCTGSTTDPECLAIQALQNTRASPSTWVAPTSPQLTGRNAVVSNPQGVLGFDPVEAAGASAAVQCRTETIVTPEVREENHCVVSAPNVALTCSLGVEIQVDPDYVYKCLTRTATNSSTACSVGQVITVESNTTYQCVERLRSNVPNACMVNRVVEVNADTSYQCVNQLRQASDTLCTVGNVVEVRADANYQCIEQARTVSNAACTVGQVVTIDPKFNYRCTNTPNAVTTSSCDRKLTVTCDPQGDGCDSGGIVPGSTQGDMRVWFGAVGAGDYALEFGTFADNYWGGWGQIYDRTLQFSINDRGGVTQFALINASFDDWLMVVVNGSLVYVGPYGGDRLEITAAPTIAIPAGASCYETYESRHALSRIVGSREWQCVIPPPTVGDGGDGVAVLYGTYGYCENRLEGDSLRFYCGMAPPGWIQYGPNSYGPPELATSWNQTLNIDLRPYLVTGTNVIFMRTIVAGAGEGAIRIRARMLCPSNCYDTWDDSECSAFRARQ